MPVVEEKEARNVSDKVRKKLKDLSVDYARGDANLHSESSSSDEETGDSSDDDLDKEVGYNISSLLCIYSQPVASAVQSIIFSQVSYQLFMFWLQEMVVI